jgi:hypothetical protein
MIEQNIAQSVPGCLMIVMFLVSPSWSCKAFHWTKDNFQHYMFSNSDTTKRYAASTQKIVQKWSFVSEST